MQVSSPIVDPKEKIREATASLKSNLSFLAGEEQENRTTKVLEQESLLVQLFKVKYLTPPDE